jgi:hypothetical protein
MTDIDALAYKLASQARAMEACKKAPYETEPVELSIGDLTLICKALHLLEVVRLSVK